MCIPRHPLYNIVIADPWEVVHQVKYEWLDLSILYADGYRLKSYLEDYAPLLF